MRSVCAVFVALITNTALTEQCGILGVNVRKRLAAVESCNVKLRSEYHSDAKLACYLNEQDIYAVRALLM